MERAGEAHHSVDLGWVGLMHKRAVNLELTLERWLLERIVSLTVCRTSVANEREKTLIWKFSCLEFWTEEMRKVGT